MMLAVAAFLVTQPLIVPQMSLRVAAAWGVAVQFAGLILILGGLGLHWWVRKHLRQFYAERLELQPGYCLIDSGPYTHVRHPLFTSFFMLAFGLLLISPALPTLLMSVYVVWDFSRVARQEEELLSQNVPGYADYMRRTSRFVPKLNTKQLLDIRSTDPADARRRKLLTILVLGALALSLLVVLATILVDVTGMAATTQMSRYDMIVLHAVAFVSLVGNVGILMINRYGSGRLASWLFLLLVTIAISFADQPRELIDGRSLISYGLPILMASVLLQPYSSFIMAGVSSLVILGIGLSIWVIPNIYGMLIFFVMAFVSWLSARSLERALEDLRAINRELDQRVRDRTQQLAEALEREHTAAVRNQTILESIGDGVLVTGSADQILVANPAANRLARRNLENLPLHKALAGVRSEVLTLIDSYMADKKPEEERSNVQFEWNKRTVAANIAPISLNSSGQAYISEGHVMVLRDVTREAELDRMKTIFLGSVSHELRTPMTAIKGYVDLLSDLEATSLSEAGRKYLDIIATNIKRLLGLANDLIDMSRIEVGELALYCEWTQLEPIIESAVDTVRQEFEKRGLSLGMQIEPDLPCLYLDRHRITQVLLNLLTNAYKYTVEGGASVRVYQVADEVQVEISDTGVGMSEEEQAHLFERFFRSRQEVVQKAGGSGLGLAIARSIVELHDGTISFQSECNEGTTFRVSLPVRQGPEQVNV
jgi:signal transduction histidine kinase